MQRQMKLSLKQRKATQTQKRVVLVNSDRIPEAQQDLNSKSPDQMSQICLGSIPGGGISRSVVC